MIDFKKYNNYLFFIFSAFLFVIIVGYGLYLYFNLDRELTEDDFNHVEVVLPIIEWGKYSTLSKQYDSASLD